VEDQEGLAVDEEANEEGQDSHEVDDLSNPEWRGPGAQGWRGPGAQRTGA
jgi:hypothetical protein